MRRARGASIVEVMISMSLVLVGTLALARVLVTSLTATASASHFTQAEARAAALVETIRAAPAATLACLAAHDGGWSACGAAYAIAPPTDRDGQRYFLDGASRVRAGKSGRLYDVTVAVGFNDSRPHTVTLRTAVFP
jgi:Tfp pilus assembly protein PilV